MIKKIIALRWRYLNEWKEGTLFIVIGLLDISRLVSSMLPYWVLSKSSQNSSFFFVILLLLYVISDNNNNNDN